MLKRLSCKHFVSVVPKFGTGKVSGETGNGSGSNKDARHDRLLSGYHGILPCDGYATYKKLAAARHDGPGVTLVYCWSHVRRGFYDQAKAGTSPIAAEALVRIAALYRIEADIRGKDAGQRLVVRQAKSHTLVAALRTWFQAKAATLPARGPVAQAIGYALKHWDGLERFLHDGRIELDTNTVERAMRPVALSRTNALLAGSDEGAGNWAAIASLIETCKPTGVGPQRYLTEMLTRLVNGWSKARIDELMPWHWGPPAPC